MVYLLWLKFNIFCFLVFAVVSNKKCNLDKKKESFLLIQLSKVWHPHKNHIQYLTNIYFEPYSACDIAAVIQVVAHTDIQDKKKWHIYDATLRIRKEYLLNNFVRARLHS